MTKKLFIVCAVFVWSVALVAQNIAVVSPSGSTIMCKTLTQAVDTAVAGSVIYLPGGGFPISDNVKITKKLSIFGIGHKAKNKNADGITTINGNLFFNEHSSGSAVMGCYITGDIYIGQDGNAVNDILVRYCNLNSVQIKNKSCQETVINKNYVRSRSSFGDTNAQITNNIMVGFRHVDGGTIKNNIITRWGDELVGFLNYIYNSYFTKNVWGGVWTNGSGYSMSNNTFYDNLGSSYGDEGKPFENGASWTDVFENFNEIPSPVYDYHFKEEFSSKYSDYGVYADGVDFDKQLAPVPHIVAKKIDEQTDASGKLNIKIRVKASGEE